MRHSNFLFPFAIVCHINYYKKAKFYFFYFLIIFSILLTLKYLYILVSYRDFSNKNSIFAYLLFLIVLCIIYIFSYFQCIILILKNLIKVQLILTCFFPFFQIVILIQLDLNLNRNTILNLLHLYPSLLQLHQQLLIYLLNHY